MNNHLVYLYCSFLQDVDSSLFPHYGKCISEDERRQYGQLRFQRQKQNYLVTRALVRNVLSLHTSTAPEALRFVKDAYGKPTLSFPELNPGLNFNISHSKKLVVCSVTYGGALGVDVETIDREKYSNPSWVRFVLSGREISHFSCLSKLQQQKRFIEYWTLKESYLKAVGTGLIHPLNQYSFELEENEFGQIMSIHLQDAIEQPQWAFWLLKPLKCERMALSLNVREAALPQLIMHTVIPFKSIVETVYPVLYAPGNKM